MQDWLRGAKTLGDLGQELPQHKPFRLKFGGQGIACSGGRKIGRRKEFQMIRGFEPTDADQAASLLARAYERDDELNLVQSLRERRELQTELVWDQDGVILGHATMARHLHPIGWQTISTVAVDASVRGQGIGSDLVRACLEAARQADAGAVTVLGNVRYYQRFGFTRSAAEALETPFSRDETLMYPIRIENAGIMAELVYPAPYSRS